MTDANGVERAIPCDKLKIGGVVHRMVEKRREYYLGSGDILRFRMWSAYVPSYCMQGLSHSDMAPPPTTVAEFLAAYRFDNSHDEENTGSGIAPLMLASLPGNVEVVRELLIGSHGVNVNARVLVDDMNADFGFERGTTALGMAAYLCPHALVQEVVSMLLASGADPNVTAHGTGLTPLMGAVLGQSLEGVRAVLACDRLNLEIGLKVNNATALNLAGFMSTYAIIEALLHAGADWSHR